VVPPETSCCLPPCLTTVISRHAERGVVDAGLKSVSAEYGLPVAVTPGVNCLDLSDEHMQISIADRFDLDVGDRLLLIPGLVDPTVNLHDALFVVDAFGAVSDWPVDGRRSARAALAL
jgi:D-serine deaminase-like pyridoxal phosphate-dependent protein